MAKSTITVKLLGDNRDLARALGDSESRIGRFSSGAGRLLKGGAIALGGVGAAALVAAPKVLELGSSLEAMGVKSATVFEDSLGDMQTWAKELAPSLGMTRDQLVGAAAAMGDLLKPMGFTAGQAADMSADMLDLSGALAAWSDGQYDAAGVAEILSKAMLGEREQLKALGISISEADVQARLAAKGQAELTGEALAQAKALATQELILEKSTDAQRAWTDGSMDALKAQNESAASMKNLQENLVRALYPALQAAIPVITKVAEWIGEHLPGAIAAAERAGRAVVSWWEQNWPKIEPVVRRVGEFVLTVFNGIKNWVDTNWPAIRDTIAGVVEAIRNVIEAVIGAVQVIWEKYGDEIRQYAERVWNAIREVIGGAMKAIKGVIDAVSAILRGDWSAFWDGLKDIVAGVWETISGLVGTALANIKLAIDAAWQTVKDVASTAWDGIKDVISGALDAVVGFFQPAIDAATTIWDGFWKGLSAVIDGVKAGIRVAISPIVAIIDTVSRAVQRVKEAWEALQRAFGLTPNLSGSIAPGVTLPSNVPSTVLHGGGWVGNPSGPPRDIPAVLQQGEFVVSRDDAARGVGGDVINVHGQVIDPRFVDELERMLRVREMARIG